MGGKRYKKMLVSVMAGTMLCTSIPVNVLAKPPVVKMQAEQKATLQAEFASEYAKVGEELKVTVPTGMDCTYKWFVGGKEIANDQNYYTPSVDDLEKWITVKVASGTQEVEKSMYCSKLPVIYIDTENQAPILDKVNYVNGTMRMQGNDAFNAESTTLYNGAIGIRGRGNSTWGMPKKPYKIKLDKSTNIMGMGKNKHWVLLANYSDTSLMRNTLAYNFSGQLGMPQMETTWVDVILNGEYVGNYQFCEQVKIAKDRIDVFDWEGLAGDAAEAIAEAEGIADAGDLEDYLNEHMDWVTSKKVTYEGKEYQVDDYVEIPDITGGYLMELDAYFDEASRFRTKANQPIMFKSPEFVKTNDTMMNYVKEYIQAFEDAVQSSEYSADYKGEKKHYTELFDFDSLVDYWLINEIFFNEELNKKSTYLYKGIDELIKMGPIWDMDYSSGGEGQTWITNEWATNHFHDGAQAQMWYKSLIKDPYFVMKAQERYWEIRDTYVEDMVKKDGIIDSNYELLKESGKVNSTMWKYKGHDFVTGTKVLRDWMNTHLTWLDTQFDTEDSVLNSLGSYKAGNVTLTLADADGNALEADTVSEKAKADGIVEDGRDLNLQIQTTQSNAVNAKVFVNGIPTATVKLENGKSDYKLSADQLTADAGKKDIIEVKVLDSSNNYVASNYSTVLEKEKEDRVIGLEISMPDKLEYVVGEEFDATGLAVYAVKESGEKVDVTAEAQISGFDSSKAGGIAITISYGEFKGEIDLLIKEKEQTEAANKMYLNALIKYAKSQQEKEEYKDVIPVVKTAFETALAEAIAVTGDMDASQEEVDAAYDKLLETANYLGFTGNSESLQVLVDVAEAINQDLYTPESAEALANALAKSKEILADENALQAEIDVAVKVLQRAIDGLVERVEDADKESLEALIKYAQSQQEKEEYKDVIPAVKDAFEKALAEAVAVYENKGATQEQVDAAYEKLLDMVHYLTFTGNSDSLRALVEIAKGMNLDIYTQETVDAFNDALAKAEEVLANENALQKEIDNARDALQAAMDGLKVIPSDKSKLQKLVDKSKKYEDAIAEYTPASAEIFGGALANARNILAKEGATQEEVDKAYAELQNAIFGLRLLPNKDKLEDLIADAVKVDTANYTAETAVAFKAALDHAKAVFADENATEADVKAAEKALKKAQNNLVAKVDVDNDKKDSDKVASSNTSNGVKSQPKTGDAATALPAAMAGLAALAAVIASKKKR